MLYKIYSYIVNYMQMHRYKLLKDKYDIHPSFRFNGKDIYFYGNGKLEIAENSYIGGLSTIQLHDEAYVKIGKGCSISHNVRMYTSSNAPDYDFSDKKNVLEKKGNIIIGDYVWIGANVFINPGVVIGENSVIGANSVVTKNIEAFGIYGGVPAKLIRMKKINV